MRTATGQRRFSQWLSETKQTQTKVAERLGCSVGFVNLVCRGHRKPGRVLANKIWHLTKHWSRGAVLPQEWDRETRTNKAA
jgi:hypothetical protein